MVYPSSRSIRTTFLTRRTETCTRRSPPPTRLGTTGLEVLLTSVDVGCAVDVIRFDPVGPTTRVSINVWNFSASRQSVTHSSSSAGDTDPKRVRTKLMKFLMKRPTLQSVKEKGYIRGKIKAVWNLRSRCGYFSLHQLVLHQFLAIIMILFHYFQNNCYS